MTIQPPVRVLSASGVAETDAVFIMPEKQTVDAIWLITEHEPAQHAIAFVKVTPGHTVGQVEIELAADGAKRTVATVTYQYTALSAAGEAFAGFH
jgi:hypothetical protein